MPQSKPLIRTILLQALLAAALWLFAGPGELLANGATRLLVKDAQAGPYLLQVGILPGTPRVGTLHVTVLVNEAAGGTPLSDALVDVMVRGPEDATDAGPVRATNSVQDLRFYEANLPLDVKGSWTLTVDTHGALGQGQLTLPLQVKASQSLDLVYVLAAIVAVSALSLWLWDRLRAGRKRRSQES